MQQTRYPRGWFLSWAKVSVATEKDGNLMGFRQEQQGKDKGAPSRSLARS